ncbi:adenylate kinase [Sphingobacterium alkalisoli]|uniref:Adenylate kinase n=1 Tax=Sphingobacterium alkalisoli TaxID=1874115 RepID=A0A4U0GXS9_9SPHI|nr:adenylate kinase [Sphingobacterium alkalisoli]TJY63878.1 adenylate kinase [Sphingobacterium alkalisoli]GGH24295.1 adenylate kinase [Sphingobacterium alkalisoli]
MLNLVLFGPPGAGKGTQSEKLIDKYRLVHVSTGDIFRSHIKNQTSLGQQVNQIIAEGNLVPDSITIAMLEEEIKKNPHAEGFIFDGFPRTVAQAKALDNFLMDNNTSITGVIALDVTEEELTQRIAKRQEISGRADDAADKLKKRIEEYFSKTIHVLPYYDEQGKLSKVNGIGDIETIFAELSAVIDEYNA